MELNLENGKTVHVGEGTNDGRVWLSVDGPGRSSPFVELTPEQAREVAVWLAEHANRIDPPKPRGQTAAEAEAAFVYRINEGGVITAVLKANDPEFAQEVGQVFKFRIPGTVAENGNIWLSATEQAARGRVKIKARDAGTAGLHGWRSVEGTYDRVFGTVEVERD